MPRDARLGCHFTGGQTAERLQVGANDDEMTEVAYDLSVDDLIAFRKKTLWSDPLVKRLILVRMLVMMLVVPLCFGFWGYVRQIPFPPEAIYFVPFTIVLIFFLAIVPWQVYRQQIRSFRRLCSQGEGRKMVGRWRVIFSPEAVTIEGAGTTSTNAWSAFSNVALTDAFVVLYMDQSPAFTIPRRAFPNGHQVANFVEILRRRISAESLKT
jgi:hypothetical protein